MIFENYCTLLFVVILNISSVLAFEYNNKENNVKSFKKIKTPYGLTEILQIRLYIDWF